MFLFNHETVRHLLVNYHNLPALLDNELSSSDLVCQSLWMPYDVASSLNLSLAMRALLDWGLDQLKKKGTQTVLTSFNTLDKRYRQQLSVSVFAREYDLNEQTIQKRRQAGTRRLARILEAEQSDPQHLEARKAYAIQTHYQSLTPEEQQLLKAVALLESPINDAMVLLISPQFKKPSRQKLRTAHLVVENDNGLTIHPAIQKAMIAHTSYDEQRDIYETLAHCYLTRADKLNAIDCFLKATNHLEAANVLLSMPEHEILKAITLLDTFLEHFDQHKLPAETWFQLRFWAGRIAELSDNLEKSIAEYETALATENKLLSVTIYLKLSGIYRLQSDYETALMYSGMARSLLEPTTSAAEIKLLFEALLREVLYYSSDLLEFDKAKTHLEKADALLKEIEGINDKEWLPIRSDLSRRWGDLYFGLEDYDESARHHRKSRIYALEANDVKRRIAATYDLGGVYARGKEDYAKALKAYRECLLLCEETGNHQFQAGINVEIAYCLKEQGQYDAALIHLNSAHDYAKETNNLYMLGIIVFHLAQCHLWAGSITSGLQAYRELCQLNEDANNVAHLVAVIDMLKKEYPFIGSAINERQFRGLVYLQKHKAIKRQQYVQLCAIGSSMAKIELNELVELGLCERHGRGRGVHYILVEHEEVAETAAPS